MDGLRSPPPRPDRTSEPRLRCVPPLGASASAAAGPGCGGEGREPDGRRGGLCPEPPPSCGPRGRRGSPPAPCPPARPHGVLAPGRPRRGPGCASRRLGARAPGSAGASGRRSAPLGRHGPRARRSRPRASPGVFPVRCRTLSSRETQQCLAGTDPECWHGPKRAAESCASAGACMVVG